MFKKFKKGIVTLVLGIVLLATLIVQSAGATPPQEEIVFDPIYVTYAPGNFTTIDGYWISTAGLFEGAGDAVQSAVHAGWPGNGWQFQNGTLTTTLSDDKGTITIKDQITRIEWMGLDSIGTGNWVISDGTGAYTNLHGQGTSNLISIYHDPCPDTSVNVCITIEMELNGSGHFDP